LPTKKDTFLCPAVLGNSISYLKKGNYKFIQIFLSKDKIMEGVLTLLKKAGINFENLKINGINPNNFADYASGAGNKYIKQIFEGLILNEDLKWIVFHGGFDFGYLIHMFHHSGLPETSEEFSSLMRLYFPQTYDLKCSLRENTLLRDVGLTKLA
jgi:CCR4-NOT transcription complex subunit 7/8